MKYFLPLFIFIQVQFSFASDNYLLYCLGQEEKAIHGQKKNGALSYLNQELISELIQFSETIKMKSKYLDIICHPETKYKSLMTLKFSLLKENLFYSTRSKDDLSLMAIDKTLIEDFHNSSIKLFIQFINHLQAQSPKANCLEKKIPELKKFYKNGRYILEDIGLDKIIGHKHNYELIFKKLASETLFQDC